MLTSVARNVRTGFNFFNACCGLIDSRSPTSLLEKATKDTAWPTCKPNSLAVAASVAN